MNFDTEKLLAKVAGENVENFANCVISDFARTQIDFAFNQMFQGQKEYVKNSKKQYSCK